MVLGLISLWVRWYILIKWFGRKNERSHRDLNPGRHRSPNESRRDPVVVQENMKSLSHRLGLPTGLERVESLATRLCERK